MVCVLLADGFEESEAVVPMDLLRRGGVEVMLAGVQSLTVKSSHALTVTADCLLSEVAPEQVEMVFVPGGLGGVNNLRNPVWLTFWASALRLKRMSPRSVRAPRYCPGWD